MGWDNYIDCTTAPPKLNDAKDRKVALSETVWLTVRFANTLYIVRFRVADRLAVEVLIGTAFLNKHVKGSFPERWRADRETV